jgi:NTE family protein
VSRESPTAFVLGGGGVLGAHEVGMLEALAGAGIVPDLILGTSIGAINGAFAAGDPSLEGMRTLRGLWCDSLIDELSSGGLLRRAGTLARSGTHLEPLPRLRDRLREALPAQRVEALAVPFQCVAASIERAAEHWFASGDLAEVLLASCAVPGILPPVRIDGEHYIDGGIVNSIPVNRAIALGAARVFVLQVGRVEQPLRPPRWPWEVGLVAFEVARRHRFAHDLREMPEHVELHVLPTGGSAAPAYNDITGLLALRRPGRHVAGWIDAARDASARYLEEL